MLVLVAKYLIPKGFRGITLFPFIFLRHRSDKMNRVTVNHEKIHLYQQLELLIIPFFIWYAVEFLVRWVEYKNRHKAYRNISFEKEAYQNEQNLNYGASRKWFSFTKYL